MTEIKGTSKVGNKGQTTIPVAIREKLGIREGDLILWRCYEIEGGVVVRVEKIPIPED